MSNCIMFLFIQSIFISSPSGCATTTSSASITPSSNLERFSPVLVPRRQKQEAAAAATAAAAAAAGLQLPHALKEKQEAGVTRVDAADCSSRIRSMAFPHLKENKRK